MTQYWFARYRAGPQSGRGLVPLSWQGVLVIVGFVLAMVAGALCFVLLAVLTQQFVLGAAIFILCAIAGGSTFIWAAVTKSDPVRSVYDYQNPQAAAVPDRLASIEASLAAMKDELSKLRADLAATRGDSGDLN